MAGLARATLATGAAVLVAGWSGGASPSPFAIEATYTAKSLGLRDPQHLTIGPNGNLYVTDRSQRVTLISPSGKVIRRWGKPGSGRGEFHFASSDPSDPNEINGAVAVGPDGEVYVSDGRSARVEIFTRRGRFVRQFGSFGNGKGQFLFPFDLVVDRASNVYVTDDQRATLSKFSPSSKELWRIGGQTSGDPDLVGHFHLASIDAHGRLVIANDAKGRILYVDRNGHKVDAFGGPAKGSLPARSRDFPHGACEPPTLDARGNIYVNGCAPAPTQVFDRAHRLIAEWRGAPLLVRSPAFGPHGEVFALYLGPKLAGGGILKLKVTLPGA